MNHPSSRVEKWIHRVRSSKEGLLLPLVEKDERPFQEPPLPPRNYYFPSTCYCRYHQPSNPVDVPLLLPHPRFLALPFLLVP